MYPYIREVSGTRTAFTAPFVTEMSAVATWADMTWNGISAKPCTRPASVKAAKSQSTLSFQPVSSALTEKVMRAELHCLSNITFLTPLFCGVFPDS